jgi:hypothetical protein
MHTQQQPEQLQRKKKNKRTRGEKKKSQRRQRKEKKKRRERFASQLYGFRYIPKNLLEMVESLTSKNDSVGLSLKNFCHLTIKTFISNRTEETTYTFG